MTENLLPIYGCAALTISLLGVFARQNRKEGWKRKRSTAAEALERLYADLGMPLTSAKEPVNIPDWTPVLPQEAVSFSAQMLRMRSALGTATPVTRESPVRDRELVLQ